MPDYNINDPRNPRSPFNMWNPDSPYNPYNPRSPYYDPSTSMSFVDWVIGFILSAVLVALLFVGCWAVTVLPSSGGFVLTMGFIVFFGIAQALFMIGRKIQGED
jgi:hypothetical protein